MTRIPGFWVFIADLSINLEVTCLFGASGSETFLEYAYDLGELAGGALYTGFDCHVARPRLNYVRCLCLMLSICGGVGTLAGKGAAVGL